MARSFETRTLHFALSHVAGDVPVRLHVGTDRVAVERHTAETLAAARATNRALQLLPDAQVTHYASDVPLPADQAQLLFVTMPSRAPRAKLPLILLTKIHVPKAARVAATRRRFAQGANAPHPALLLAGVADDGTDPELPPDVDDWTSAMDAAVQTVFQHGELFNIGATVAATVTDTITYANGTSDLASWIDQQAMAYQRDSTLQNWVYETPYSNPDGSPSNVNRYTWSATTQQWAVGAMQSSVRQTKDDPDLQSSSSVAGLYTVQSGVTAVASTQGGSQERLSGPHLVQAAPQADDGGTYWTVNQLTPMNGFSYNNDLAFSGGAFSCSFTNSWLRWLSGYATFLGPDGLPVVPDGWTSQVPPGVAGTYDTDTQKYVALYSSVNTMLAIPVGADPTTVSFTWPANASAVLLQAGGIGRSGGMRGQGGTYYGSWDGQVCAGGAIMTGIFNYGIPVMMLAMGASVPQSALSDMAKAVISTVLDVGSALINGPIASAVSGGDATTVLIAFADAIPHLLLDMPDLVTQLAIIGLGEDAVEECTPIFGWIALGLSILTTVADLAQTTAEVCSSPAVFEVLVTRAIDATWQLSPDPNHDDTWPLEATHYVVTAAFSDGTTRVTTGTMGPPPPSGPITVSFDAANANQLPAGGTVQFTAAFYSDTDWLCGAVSSAPLSASVSGNVLTVPAAAITENVVPLSSTTRYEYESTLTYDAQNDGYAWTPDVHPTATLSSLDETNTAPAVGALGVITVNQPEGQLAYSYQASFQNIPIGSGSGTNDQAYVFQTVSTQQNPNAGLRFVRSGFVDDAPVLYGLAEPPSGNNFYVDPSNGNYLLRQIVLDGSSGAFAFPTTSFGRFNQAMDACIVHPSGYAVGVNTVNAKLEVVNLASAAGSDADAPLAEMYAGYGARPGLLHQPVGVAPSLGAGVIVLENADAALTADARLQAFDLLGNPAPIFAGGTSTAALNAETQPVTALAVATESKGYIYVLKYLGTAPQPVDYVLDVYSPDGTFLNQTAGLPAGSIAVDLWRTLYTLDYQQIAKPAGARPEPSASIWTPSTPT